MRTGAGGYLSDRQGKMKTIKGSVEEEVYGWNGGSNGGEMDTDQPAAQNG